MKFKKLPVYKVIINMDDEDTGMTAISMVDYPAIEKNWMAFAEKKPLAFAIADKAQRKVTGPAIIAGMPIYRWDWDMGEYYVVFEADEIDKIIEKYSKQNLWNSVSLQHDGNPIQSAIMTEYYQKDAAKGINPQGYEDVSDHSLFITYKITDDDLWNEIVSGDGTLNGFSIEINCDLEFTDNEIDDGYEDVEYEINDDFWAMLWEALGFAGQKKKMIDTIESAIDEENEIKLKIKDGKTVTGEAYTVFENDGSRNVAMWDGKEWHIINETNIESVKATGRAKTVDWSKALSNRGYDWVRAMITDENTSNINKVAIAPKNDIERAIVEHLWVNLSYDDLTDNPCKGYRQCQVMEYGYTTNNNAAIRVYEAMGATHNPEEMPGWRTLRLDRLTAFKINSILSPYTEAPIGFRHDGEGQDRDGFVTLLRSDL